MTETLDLRLLWAVVRRDLRFLVGSRATAVPLVVVPALLLVGLPVMVRAAPGSINLPLADVDRLVGMLPAASAATLPADPDLQLVYLLLVHLLAPVVLIIPVVLAAVSAAGSIAGERERGTLEILLLSPITDRQLFLAKTLAAWLPAVAITLAGSVVYQLVATVALADTGLRPFPNLMWTLLVAWVAPALAAVALAAVVLLSARTRTVQEAMQVGGVLVLPLVGVAMAQASGLLALGSLAVALAGVVLWGLAALLLRAGARSLHRDRLVAGLSSSS